MGYGLLLTAQGVGALCSGLGLASGRPSRAQHRRNLLFGLLTFGAGVLGLGLTRYFPLALETRDAEQLKPGGIHAKAFQRVEYDGRGRSIKSIAHIGNPTSDNIVTAIEYSPTGEPVTITRTSAGI